MKKIIIISFFSLAFITAFAQPGDKLTLAIQKGLAQLDSSKGPDQYTSTANYFERIAKVETAQWLPQYYTAYSLLLSGITGKQDEGTKDAIYDKAMSFATMADQLKPDNSDITALKGYIVFMKMAVSPQARAMSMIPQSNALLEKAMALDTENPRVYLLKGQNLFYTPEAFGGGKAKAKEVLLLAAQKFDASKAASPDPTWGRHRCNELLDQLK